MFERFTAKAREVVVHAQNDARSLKHNYVGTEHLLLGLVHPETDSMASQLLAETGVSYDRVRREVERIVGQGDEVAVGHLPFTPRAKRVLELALREALAHSSNYIGGEHILFALFRAGESVACRILTDAGVDLDTVKTSWAEKTGRRVAEDPATVDPARETELARVVAAQDSALAEISGLMNRLERLRELERQLRAAG